MVFVTLDQERSVALQGQLRHRRILIGAGATLRLVTHLDVTAEDVQTVIAQFKDFFTHRAR
jgi:threonine aldolase